MLLLKSRVHRSTWEAGSVCHVSASPRLMPRSYVTSMSFVTSRQRRNSFLGNVQSASRLHAAYRSSARKQSGDRWVVPKRQRVSTTLRAAVIYVQVHVHVYVLYGRVPSGLGTMGLYQVVLCSRTAPSLACLCCAFAASRLTAPPRCSSCRSY